MGEEWDRGSQQRGGSDRVSQPWHPSPATVFSLPTLESHFFPCLGRASGFWWKEDGLVAGPLVPLRPVFVVSATGFVQGFHISLVLFMNIFFLHAHSSFQTFGQASPCLVQAWVWLQSCLFFLFSLFCLKREVAFYMPARFPSMGCPLLSTVFASRIAGRGAVCKNLLNNRTQSNMKVLKGFSSSVASCVS